MEKTIIKLYNNVEFTNQNTVLFKTLDEQNTYFEKKVVKIIESRNTVIADQIRVSSEDMDYYNLQQINYVSTVRIINNRSKVYYYRVEEVIYENDRTTILILDLDVLQSYMFDYEITDSIIVREHQNRWDSKGNRIISQTEEPINPSKYDYMTGRITNAAAQVLQNPKLRKIHFALITEALTSEGEPTRYGAVYSHTKSHIVPFFIETGMEWQAVYIKTSGDNLFKAVSYEILGSIVKDNKIADISILGDIPDVKLYTEDNKIVADFSLLDDVGFGSKISIEDKIGDTKFVDVVSSKGYADDPLRNGVFVVSIDEAWHFESKLAARFNLDHEATIDYIFNSSGDKKEKESKLFSSQYSKISVLSGLSNSLDLFIDEMEPETKSFEFSYRIGNGVSKMTILSPLNYNVPRQVLVGGVETAIPLVSDEYINYMKNQKHSRTVSVIGGIVQGISGLATGRISQSIGSGIMSFFSEGAKRADMKNKPTQTSKEADNIDFNLSMNLIKYRIELKLPSDEDKIKLKDFFFRYGYSAAITGKPNLTTRENFNYVELDNMIIKGNIPFVDKEALKQIYKAGVRFWHNENSFLNFEIPNDER